MYLFFGIKGIGGEINWYRSWYSMFDWGLESDSELVRFFVNIVNESYKKMKRVRVREGLRTFKLFFGWVYWGFGVEMGRFS